MTIGIFLQSRANQRVIRYWHFFAKISVFNALFLVHKLLLAHTIPGIYVPFILVGDLFSSRQLYTKCEVGEKQFFEIVGRKARRDGFQGMRVTYVDKDRKIKTSIPVKFSSPSCHQFGLVDGTPFAQATSVVYDPPLNGNIFSGPALFIGIEHGIKFSENRHPKLLMDLQDSDKFRGSFRKFQLVQIRDQHILIEQADIVYSESTKHCAWANFQQYESHDGGHIWGDPIEVDTAVLFIKPPYLADPSKPKASCR